MKRVARIEQSLDVDAFVGGGAAVSHDLPTELLTRMKLVEFQSQTYFYYGWLSENHGLDEACWLSK